MAAQEYYNMGTQSATNMYPPQQQQQPLLQNPPAQPYPPQNYSTPGYANTPPPSYSPYSLQSPQNQQLGTYSSQPNITPYPTTPPTTQHFSPPPQNNGYLGDPIQPIRSHSQPPRVHFAKQESDSSNGEGSDSDSEASSKRRRHRRQRSRRSHDNSLRNDRDYDSDYSDRERERDQRHKAHRKGHKNRDTFLGAGAGGIVGDLIFPGLGTAAGLILGGYGGRKHAERSRSEEPSHHHRHRDDYRNERY